MSGCPLQPINLQSCEHRSATRDLRALSSRLQAARLQVPGCRLKAAGPQAAGSRLPGSQAAGSRLPAPRLQAQGCRLPGCRLNAARLQAPGCQAADGIPSKKPEAENQNLNLALNSAKFNEFRLNSAKFNGPGSKPGPRTQRSRTKH